jgi:hypothetical protein
LGREVYKVININFNWGEVMRDKNKDALLVEIKSIKKYASVLLTPKEFRKGRKRWIQKYGS